MEEQRRRVVVLLLLKKKALLLKRKRLNDQNEQRMARQHWVHPINQRRDTHGVYANLIHELREDCDNRRHIKYLRMTPENFDYVLELIRPHITKLDTVMREAIKPGLKLAVTLHHLAEGSSQAAIASHYRLGRSTVSGIIDETCIALWKVLQPIYLRPPSGPDEWKTVALGYVCRTYYSEI